MLYIANTIANIIYFIFGSRPPCIVNTIKEEINGKSNSNSIQNNI